MKLLCDCSYYLRDLNSDYNKQLPSGWNKVKAPHVVLINGMKIIANITHITKKSVVLLHDYTGFSKVLKLHLIAKAHHYLTPLKQLYSSSDADSFQELFGYFIIQVIRKRMYKHTHLMLKNTFSCPPQLIIQFSYNGLSSVLVYLKDFNRILLKINLNPHLPGTSGFLWSFHWNTYFSSGSSETATFPVLPDTKKVRNKNQY